MDEKDNYVETEEKNGRRGATGGGGGAWGLSPLPPNNPHGITVGQRMAGLEEQGRRNQGAGGHYPPFFFFFFFITNASIKVHSAYSFQNYSPLNMREQASERLRIYRFACLRK